MRLLILGVAALVSFQSQAFAETKPESLFLKAMALAPSGTERMGDSGAAIRAYITAKLVHRKPDDQRDYIDSRRLLKPATLMGHDLVIIEEEYRWKQYVGCCVSPGVGAVIQQRGDMTALQAYLTTNKCGIVAMENARDGLADYGVTMIAGANYWQISCRERDLQKE
jgi:hypothetical protein